MKSPKSNCLNWLLPWRARKIIKRQSETIKVLEVWIKARHPLESIIPNVVEKPEEPKKQ